MFEIKTLIELFDACQIENVIAALRFEPQKIVFVGFKEIMTKKRCSDLMRFFELRNLNIQVEYEVVSRYDYKDIVEKLNQIIDNNEDCCFDLTGGKELVLTAMGAVSATRNIPMLQFNVRTGRIVEITECGDFAESKQSTMSIEEIVTLNGGAIVKDEADDFEWNLTADFKKDIEIIWQMCKRNCGLWNRQSKVLESFEKFGSVDGDFRVRVNLKHMKDGKQDVLLNPGIINKLIEKKLISEYCVEGDVLTFKYKNEQVHQCITKAGNILELYVYMIANEIAQENPAYYDDIDVGIYVDWDGVLHDGTTSEVDTRNEIDVIFMRDLVPVFISCKNGEVHKEALYELDTMARRFGGKYAKKILLATYISTDRNSTAHIKRRALDMGIEIIDGVDLMNREEFKSVLKNRAK